MCNAIQVKCLTCHILNSHFCYEKRCDSYRLGGMTHTYACGVSHTAVAAKGSSSTQLKKNRFGVKDFKRTTRLFSKKERLVITFQKNRVLTIAA